MNSICTPSTLKRKGLARPSEVWASPEKHPLVPVECVLSYTSTRSKGKDPPPPHQRCPLAVTMPTLQSKGNTTLLRAHQSNHVWCDVRSPLELSRPLKPVAPSASTGLPLSRPLALRLHVMAPLQSKAHPMFP